MQKCKKCEVEKPLDEYMVRSQSPTGRHHTCKECINVYNRQQYQRHKQRYLDRNEAWAKQRRAENRLKLWQYKEQHPCVDCGEADPRVLQFDHTSGEKVAAVTDLAYSFKSSWAKVLSEISKCEVRCANCHMKRTWNHLGYEIPIGVQHG